MPTKTAYTIQYTDKPKRGRARGLSPTNEQQVTIIAGSLLDAVALAIDHLPHVVVTGAYSCGPGLNV